MLMQLVCVDRRYQRMNSFNIREIQGILKRRFFTDLASPKEHNQLFDSSMVGLRYRLNSTTNIYPDTLVNFNFGPSATSQKKKLLLNSLEQNLLVMTNQHHDNLNSTKLLFITTNSTFDFLKTILHKLNNYLLISLTSSMNYNQYYKNITILPKDLSLDFVQKIFTTKNLESLTPRHFQSGSLSVTSIDGNLKNAFSEKGSYLRYTRFTNPLISYDYKCGHYLGT